MLTKVVDLDVKLLQRAWNIERFFSKFSVCNRVYACLPKMSNKMPSVEVLENPVKSENDKKSYRVIRLENGLKALLISVASKKHALLEHSNDDEDADDDANNKLEAVSTAVIDSEMDELDSKLAACAVCIDVGSFSDPSDVQGMAHFLGMNHIT